MRLAVKSKNPVQSKTIPFWRDVRVLGILGQLAFILVVVLVVRTLGSNFLLNISKLGKAQFICHDGSYSLRCAFDFIQGQAGFEIAETSITYDVYSSYLQAVLVGVMNTLKVAVLAIILSTIVGTFTGIARLSNNWLLKNLAKVYIELIRNTPLLVQIVFIYFVVFLSLPQTSKAIQPLGLPIFLSQRSLSFPSLVLMPSSLIWLAFLVLGIIQFEVIWILLGAREGRTGKPSHRFIWGLACFVFITGIGWTLSIRIANDQGVLAAKATRMRTFDDLETLFINRAGINSLNNVTQLSEEQIQMAELKVCAIRDSASEPNFSSQLHQKGIPYRVVFRSDYPSQAADRYASGDCDLFAAPVSILTAQLAALEKPSTHVILTVPETPLAWSIPHREGLNIYGGAKITPEYAALLMALVIYAGAFIAEIVRSGIQAVSKGQKEAATALGLSESQKMRLIILPQSLRVIIPPLISEYLGTLKDSSLGIAIGFPDLYNISTTIINQSGRAIQVIVLVMVTYLTMSLATSALLNWYNHRIQFVER